MGEERWKGVSAPCIAKIYFLKCPFPPPKKNKTKTNYGAWKGKKNTKGKKEKLWDLRDKDIEAVVINRFKELKEIMFKKVTEVCQLYFN